MDPYSRSLAEEIVNGVSHGIMTKEAAKVREQLLPSLRYLHALRDSALSAVWGRSFAFRQAGWGALTRLRFCRNSRGASTRA